MSSDEESVPVNRIVNNNKHAEAAQPAPGAPPARKYQRLPRTEAQKAATMKGLEALAKRRAEMEVAKEKARLQQLEDAEAVAVPDEPKPKPKPTTKAKEPKQMPRPLPGALTPDMLETIKSHIRDEVASEKAKLQSEFKERKKAKTQPKKRTVIVEKDSDSSDNVSDEEEVIVRRKQSKQKPRLLSGSDLLDSIFFKH